VSTNSREVVEIISHSLAHNESQHSLTRNYYLAHEIERHLAYEIARQITSLINNVVGCVVALEPRLSTNDPAFSPVPSVALRSEEIEYIEEVGYQFFEEKQKLADEIKSLEQKKAIQTKLLEQFKTRAEASLNKCNPELINLLNKDMEKRRALIDNIEQRIKENKGCIRLIEEREVKLGAAPSAFVSARNPTNPTLASIAVTPKTSRGLSSNRFGIFAPKSCGLENHTPTNSSTPPSIRV
jgi:hypothetical protein